MTTDLFKLVPADGWPDDAAIVPWAEIDRADGFVHLSGAAQVRETAEKHFAGHGRLRLLRVVPEGLRALRWEPSRRGDLFPHVYADIPRAAVIGVHTLHEITPGTYDGWPDDVP